MPPFQAIESGVREVIASGAGSALLEQGGRLSGELAESAARAINQAAEGLGLPKIARVPIADLANSMDLLPSSLQFHNMVAGRVIGDVPQSMLNSGITSDQALGKLDSLSGMLRSFDINQLPWTHNGAARLAARDIGLPEFEIQMGDAPLAVKKAGIGNLGHVYKLSAGDEDSALKVYSGTPNFDIHGVQAETGALTFLSKYDIRDLMRYHAADPSKGWILSEFVDKPLTRSGQNLSDVLSKLKLNLTDDAPRNRGPGGIAWDVGGLMSTKDVEASSNLADFTKLLGRSETARLAGSISPYVTDSPKAAMFLALENGESAAQVPRAARGLRNDTALWREVISKALETRGAGNRAALEANRAIKPEDMRFLLHKALTVPEARIEAAKQLDFLAPQDINGAVKAAYAHPECRPMATRCLLAIPSKVERQRAIDEAMTDPGGRLTLLLAERQKNETAAISPEIKSTLDEYLSTYGLNLTSIGPK